jgi:hypothetical protein
MFLERVDLTGKAPGFVALDDFDDLREFVLVPDLPCGLPGRAALFPVVHIEPLSDGDAGRRLHLLLALDENGLDIPPFDANRDPDLVNADSGVSSGMFREEGEELLAARDAFGDGASPVVAEFDFALVEPDIVPALFEVELDAGRQLFFGVMPVTKEEAKCGDGL